MSKKEDQERALQHAIGYLVTNPRSLDKFLACGQLDAPSIQLDPSTVTAIVDFLSVESSRFGIVAQMLDERLLKNVYRFIPLSVKASALGELAGAWTAFRGKLLDHRWSEPKLCAMDFCTCFLENAAFLEFDQCFLLRQLVRYERSILEADLNFRSRVWLQKKQAAPLNAVGYPKLLIKCIFNDFPFAMTFLIKQLRNSNDISSINWPYLVTSRQGERLLTYVSWKDCCIRTLRVSKVIVQVLQQCSGTLNNQQLRRRLAATGYPPTALIKLDITLEQLESVGVIRRLAEPLVALVSNSENHV